MKFILSRTDDVRIHSKKWVVGYGLLFWLISRIVAMLLIIGCVAIYETCGIAPESQTSFIGNPETAKKIGSSIYVLLTVSVAAPLLEECIFRLGLYDYTLLPYMLCITSVPFFAGCAITYYRINLGFWWGVGLHIFNNIPAIIVMLST